MEDIDAADVCQRLSPCIGAIPNTSALSPIGSCKNFRIELFDSHTVD